MVGAIIPSSFIFFFLAFHCLFVVVLFIFNDQNYLCSYGTLICHFDFSKDLGLEFYSKTEF